MALVTSLELRAYTYHPKAWFPLSGLHAAIDFAMYCMSCAPLAFEDNNNVRWGSLHEVCANDWEDTAQYEASLQLSNIILGQHHFNLWLPCHLPLHQKWQYFKRKAAQGWSLTAQGWSLTFCPGGFLHRQSRTFRTGRKSPLAWPGRKSPLAWPGRKSPLAWPRGWEMHIVPTQQHSQRIMFYLHEFHDLERCLRGKQKRSEFLAELFTFRISYKTHVVVGRNADHSCAKKTWLFYSSDLVCSISLSKVFFWIGAARLVRNGHLVLGCPRSTMEKGPQSNESHERENTWNRTISTVLWVHRKLPQSTVKATLPRKESYESKTGCNRTLATVPWTAHNKLIRFEDCWDNSRTSLGETLPRLPSLPSCLCCRRCC